MDGLRERLREAIFAISPTQKGAAEKCGMTESAMSRYANGERFPRADALRTICLKSGYSADYILGLADLHGKNWIEGLHTGMEVILEDLRQFIGEKEVKDGR